MNLLVTGGAGFIGSNFIHYWLKEHPEDKIVNFDVLTYAGNLDSLKDVADNPNYQFVQGDIRDTKAVDEVMQKIDMVVHFAAESHVDRSVMGPLIFSQTNVLGTHTLLEAARKYEVKRFHHVSTDEVFGALELDDPEAFNEQTKFEPRSPYAASKAGSDLMVNAYFTTYGLPVTTTNTANNYGPYMYPEKLIPLFITNAIDDQPLPVYGDGKSVREHLHVWDHCHAIDLVLHEGKIGETYCVGSNEEKNTLEVAEAILKILKKPPPPNPPLNKGGLIQMVKDRPGHDRRYAIDSNKIEKELGWRPEHNFEEWLGKTVQWYLDNQDWWRKIRDGKSYQEYYDKQYKERLK